MSRHVVGPVVLLAPEHTTREVEVSDFGGVAHAAQESPAVVAGADGVLLEVAYRRWDDGGMVVALGRGDSSPAFDRLLHGERLGVKALEDGTEFVEADLLRWDPAKEWGNSTMASPDELDALLGASADALLVGVGALDFGTREDVLGDTSKRRNRLCATFPATEALGPLAVYVLTRVLPIATAEGAA